MRYGDEYGTEASRILCRKDFERAHEFVRLLSGYEPTPLIDSHHLAAECDVATVAIKTEGSRAPTHSFKVLGPPYALGRQLLSRLGASLQQSKELSAGMLKAQLKQITACAATSGNHGRALAWAAAEFGCQCRIYMPKSTGVYREEQIQRFGSRTIRVPGNYDESVSRAVQESEQNGFILVGDGARADSQVPRQIIQGYSVLGEELISSFHADSRPSHLFVPAGSGSLAAGVTARLWMEYGPQRPKIVVVQPSSADSGYQSCLNATHVASQGTLVTMMDGLAVRELSTDAWTILSSGAFAFITIDDDIALAMLKSLAHDGQLAIGETGVAALAAFKAAAHDPKIRRQLRIDEKSRVILIATEGVTDPHVVNGLLSD
ncbi:MAG: diaminopropionate ammonia-lyase [Pirellulaceae bacterium]